MPLPKPRATKERTNSFSLRESAPPKRTSRSVTSTFENHKTAAVEPPSRVVPQTAPPASPLLDAVAEPTAADTAVPPHELPLPVADVLPAEVQGGERAEAKTATERSGCVVCMHLVRVRCNAAS